jgi:hypothetical protein
MPIKRRGMEYQYNSPEQLVATHDSAVVQFRRGGARVDLRSRTSRPDPIGEQYCAEQLSHEKSDEDEDPNAGG